jgi:hypothetical protein
MAGKPSNTHKRSFINLSLLPYIQELDFDIFGIVSTLTVQGDDNAYILIVES